MQNRWVPFFVNRSIYYASKAFVAQRKKFDEAGVRTAVLYQFIPVCAGLCGLHHEFYAKGAWGDKV